MTTASSKLGSFLVGVGIALGLPALATTVYNVFSPGGALGGTWNSQTVNLNAGSSFILNQLPITAGGTGAATSGGARANLLAAQSGANSDITSLSGLSTPLSVSQGGTGVGTLTGLALGSGTSAFAAYAGTSCTNQFPRSLNASGSATCASVSLASDVTNTLPVGSGGTGNTTLTAHGVLLGEGTAALASVAAMSADTLLQGQGASADPAAVSLTNCGDSTHALAYSTSTHTFSCQAISAGSSGPTLVQKAFTRTNSGSSGVVTLGSSPTTGDYLVGIATGFDNGGATQVGLPSGFTTINHTTVNATQGVIVGYRIVQGGDGTAWTFSGGNGGDTYGLFEFSSNVHNITVTTNQPTTSGFVLTFGNAGVPLGGYAFGSAESDSTNAYSSIAGATLLFDGTNVAGNHPGVIFQSTAYSNVQITYSTTTSFGSTIGSLTQIE